MAVEEGIGSIFPTQPSDRPPKLRIYESLFLPNQGVDHVIAILRALDTFPLDWQSEDLHMLREYRKPIAR